MGRSTRLSDMTWFVRKFRKSRWVTEPGGRRNIARQAGRLVHVGSHFPISRANPILPFEGWVFPSWKSDYDTVLLSHTGRTRDRANFSRHSRRNQGAISPPPSAQRASRPAWSCGQSRGVWGDEAWLLLAWAFMPGSRCWPAFMMPMR